MIRFGLLFLLLATTRLAAQTDCNGIAQAGNYFYATAAQPNESEARQSALSLLIGQISAVVSSNTELITRESSQSNDQVFSNFTRSVTRLHLQGIQYSVCPRAKKDGLVEVMAYISREDLRKSTDAVTAQVNQYLELMEQKRLIGIDYLAEAYAAYLYTFFSPYPIPFSLGDKKGGNVQGYLESMLRGYLSGITVRCKDVEENKDYPEAQLTVHLELSGMGETNMRLQLDCPDYNARTILDAEHNDLEVIMQPNSGVERFYGKLTLKPAQLATELKEIASQILITREVSFDVPMDAVIRINFNIKENNGMISLIPDLRHISVRKFEWFTGDRLFSTAQQPSVAPSQLQGDITLRINEQTGLIRKKTLDGLVVPVKTNTKELVQTPDPVQNVPKEFTTGISDFAELKSTLSALKSSGKAAVGKKSDFYKPEQCWVFLVEPDGNKVAYVLSPESNGRMDIRSKKVISDFENQLKGFISIWVELF